MPSRMRSSGPRLPAALRNAAGTSDVADIGRKGITSPGDARTIAYEVAHEALAGATLPGARMGAYSMLRRVTTLGGLRSDLYLREEVTRLAVPTLFLWGDVDSFAPPSSGGTVAAAMPQARLEVIKDAGHRPHLDAPATVATAINRFLATGRHADRPRRGRATLDARTRL